MPPGHLRHDRPRRKRFRDDPPLVRVTPPSPATNATANLDAPSRRGSVNYMVDHICEPMPSTGSHLPNYAARCKMGAKDRSDVRSQGPGRTRPSASTSGSKEMIAHRWGRNLKDVGDQVLMRGLGTAFPSVPPGLSPSYSGRRLKAGHKAHAGHSSAAAPPPPLRGSRVRRSGDAQDGRIRRFRSGGTAACG